MAADDVERGQPPRLAEPYPSVGQVMQIAEIVELAEHARYRGWLDPHPLRKDGSSHGLVELVLEVVDRLRVVLDGWGQRPAALTSLWNPPMLTPQDMACLIMPCRSPRGEWREATRA